ncbi:TPA: type II toxin-antitoxin system RelE/ParE family toxin [Legionella pneumophila]|nr:type II toxin-antitoxin system RelE/ParE family toxin [Legionella pneumophila]HBD9260111.1 type II toxin-antitoxin system RelE/ParE family toxin [Legionella pneumophila]HCX3262841.1 type II toxin-antitoxin system RelE/ParE family toxin [Legionella pneumophila]HCX3599065.1 type II toxin-antitoxin system RelE/ParE family toxin [Legionella pneumophila]HDI4841929.1 type II toxin-antitoxin system RelE/ParE family toxin [Legionella pneumophila]
MEIYKITAFSEWADEYNVSDELLFETIIEMNNGLFDANLGGNVYKKRIPLDNKGKRGGARTIIAFKYNDKAFFIYSFAKNKQANISDKELKALKKLAKVYFSLTDKEIIEALRLGNLIKVDKK